MGPAALYYMFGGLLLIGHLPFVVFVIKETAGLTDKMKKSLYSRW
jgi:hypothetical protein